MASKSIMNSADYEIMIRTKRVHLPDDTFLNIYQNLRHKGIEEVVLTKKVSSANVIVRFGGNEYRGSTIKEAMRGYFTACKSFETDASIIDSVLEREELEMKRRRKMIAAIISRKVKEAEEAGRK